ncbi:MAG: zinc ribbon domain-containing protein [Clostridia bacterium]
MDFLKNAVKDVGKRSGKLVESTKLSAKIASEEGKLKKLYADLGEEVYKEYTKGEKFDGKFNQLFSDINLALKAIEELKDEQADVKGVKECQNCGAEIKQEAKFCTNCGAAQEDEPAAMPETKNCPNCGAELDIDAKFCPECGTTME